MLKNTLRGSLFIRSFRIAKSNPGKIGLIIMFDFLFFASLYAVYRLALNFAPMFAVPQASTLVYISIILSVIYYLIALFIYSFFKFCVMDSVKSLFQKSDFSFKRFASFYLLNLIVGAIFFAIMLFLNLILDSIKDPLAPYVFILLATPYILILYLTANISQSNFFNDYPVKKSIIKTFGTAFRKIRNYRELVLVLALFAVVFGLVFWLGNYLVTLIASRNYSLYLEVYAYSKLISVITFDAVFYLIILMNRISFYSMAKELK